MKADLSDCDKLEEAFKLPITENRKGKSSAKRKQTANT